MENYEYIIAYQQMLNEDVPTGGMGAQVGGPFGDTTDLGPGDARVPSIVIPMMKRRLAIGGKDHQKELKKILNQMSKQYSKVKVIHEDDDVYDIELSDPIYKRPKDDEYKDDIEDYDNEDDDNDDDSFSSMPISGDDKYDVVCKLIKDAIGRNVSHVKGSVFNILDEDGYVDYTIELNNNKEKRGFILNKKRIYTVDDSLGFDKIMKGIHKKFLSSIEAPTRIGERKESSDAGNYLKTKTKSYKNSNGELIDAEYWRIPDWVTKPEQLAKDLQTQGYKIYYSGYYDVDEHIANGHKTNSNTIKDAFDKVSKEYATIIKQRWTNKED